MRKFELEKGNFVPFLPKQLLLAMRITSFLLLVACMQVYATGRGQERISLRLNGASIKRLFQEVEKQTNYRFVYHNQTISGNTKVTVVTQNANLDEVLGKAFTGTDLAYSMKEEGLVVIYSSTDMNHGKPLDVSIAGRVLDESNQPLSDVSVKLQGTTIGTFTNSSGFFTLKAPDTNGTLEFSLVGYIASAVPINGRPVINVNLGLDVKSLGGVTVTGYTNYTRNKSVSATSTVSAEKINYVPVSTLEQTLQGRVPGLSVIASSGQPGTAASVTIRGLGTIAGSTAVLYILDGVPIEASFFQTINPGDVESVTVLKDASAKAQYGSRGSNGVIVITTKRGKSGRIQVDYNSQYGFNKLTEPEFIMMNAEQRLRFEEEVGLETISTSSPGGTVIGPGWTYSSKNPAYASKTPAEKLRADFIIDSLRNVNTDWRDIFFQKSQFMEQQLSLKGGSENVRFYTSANYFKQTGIAKRTGMERVSLKSNVDFNSGKLFGSLNLTLGYSSSEFLLEEGSTGFGNAVASAYYALPYEYPYTPDGVLVHSGNRNLYPVFDQREGSNTLERVLNTSTKTKQFKSIIGMSLNYNLLPSLVAKTKVGLDLRQSLDENFVNPDSYYGSTTGTTGVPVVGRRGAFGEGSRNNATIISTSGLTYSRKISNLHDFEVSGYFEYIMNRFRSFNYRGYGIEGRLPETPAGVTVSSTFLPRIGGGRTQSGLLSYIGIGRYTYNDKYTVNASYRYDGSSTVPSKNRWQGFYSFGLGWDVKQENFMDKFDFIPALRLRSSYGTTASQFNGDFNYLPTYGSTTYGGIAGIRPVTPGNPDYDWEFTKEFNIGFDLSLFKSGRVRIIADAYNKLTDNLFFGQNLSITSGFTTPLLQSLGQMQNRGIEMDIQGDVVKTKEVLWTLGVNFGHNKNKILDLGGTLQQKEGDTRIIKLGMPYGSYFAPNWAGVDPATGKPTFYNKDKSVTSTYNEAEQQVAESGSRYPTLTGGFTSVFSWKGLTANVLLSFVENVKRWNNEDFYNENPRFMTSNQTLRMLNERWKKPGDIAILQKITEPRYFSSKDIQDASFLRLRNVNIGYALPSEITNRLRFVRGIQVFVQGQNLLTWTKWRGLDPENNEQFGRYQYPVARTFTAGLNVNL